MTTEGKKIEGKKWYPEPIYMFATAVIMNLPTRKILFTQSKDREEWIPGAGGEVIIPADTSQPVLLQTTAIKETEEELCTKGNEAADKPGLQIKLQGPCAFYMEALCGEASHYDDAHGLYTYFLASLINPEDKDKITRKKQPDEKECETIGDAWLTTEEFLTKVESGDMKTYPNIVRVLKALDEILNQQSNPFFQQWTPPEF